MLSVGRAVGLDVGALLLAVRVQIYDRLLVASPDVVRIQPCPCGGSVIGVLQFSIDRAGRSCQTSMNSSDRGDAGSFDSGDAPNSIGASADIAGLKSRSGASQLAHELSLRLRPFGLIADGGRYRGAVQLDPRSDQSAGPTRNS